MPLLQSVVLPAFRPRDRALDDFLAEIAAIGFAAIEIWDRGPDFPEIVTAAQRHGLRLCSFVGHTHTSPTAGGHAEGFSRRANHDRLEAELRESIELAARHEVPGLIVLSGHRNRGESDLAALEVCAEGLCRVAPWAERAGVNLNLELLNTRVDHPHYLCDGTDWAVALCQRVNSPRCRILYDIYHMQIMEGDVIRTLRRAAPWIGHYHTAGVPGRHELDDTQELNYRAICRAIVDTGYTGYLGHEFFPRGDRIAALRQAYALCQGT
jgi:hydroxypyruvate isomerase